MKPDVDFVLRMIAAKLSTEVGPALADSYARSNVEVAAGLLLAAAEDYDRAAQVRVEENRALRTLFGEAAKHVPAAELQRKLEAAAASADPSVRIGELEAENGRLRSLLIELHAYVETRTEEWAVQLCGAIWRELRAGTERRAIGFYPL